MYPENNDVNVPQSDDQPQIPEQSFQPPFNNMASQPQPMVNPLPVQEPTVQMPVSEQIVDKPTSHKKIIIILLAFIAASIVIAAGIWYVRASDQATNDQYTARYHFQAGSNVSTIATKLEFFYTTNKYYPSDIDPTTLGDLNIKLDQDVQAAPANIKYVYTPFPAGCTTKTKTCTSYELGAVDVVTNENVKTVRAKGGL